MTDPTQTTPDRPVDKAAWLRRLQRGRTGWAEAAEAVLGENEKLRADAAAYESPAWAANERLNTVVDEQATEIDKLSAFEAFQHINRGYGAKWPNEPGVPLHPAQNGAHMLTHASPDYPIQGQWMLLWCAPERLWTDLYGNRQAPESMAIHRYVGPMTAPSDICGAREPMTNPDRLTTARQSNDWPPDLAALRSAANKIGNEFWYNKSGTSDVYSGPDAVVRCKSAGAGSPTATADFVARASPAMILYLLSKLVQTA